MYQKMARFIVADWDDMVFADRNKEFGAYDLRKKYPRTLLFGTFSISLLMLLGSFGPLWAKRMGWLETQRMATTSQPTDIEIILPPVDPPVDPPVPPTPPDLPPPVATVEFLAPEPVPEGEEDPDPTIETVERLEQAPNFGHETVEGEDIALPFDGDLVDGDVPEVIVSGDIGPGIFISVDEEPVAVNIDDIKSLIGYPQLAADADVEGVMVARILVDKLGNYKKHIVIRDAHPLLQDEVEKHLSKLKFTPAIQGGRPISFWVNVPFRFQLFE